MEFKKWLESNWNIYWDGNVEKYCLVKPYYKLYPTKDDIDFIYLNDNQITNLEKIYERKA